MPRIVDHEARRAELLQGAEEVFATEGYAALSMRQLAKALGVSTGTLYHYFPTKQALFDALVDKVVDREVGAIEGLRLVDLPAELRGPALLALLTSTEDAFGAELSVLMEAARQQGEGRPDFEVRMFEANARYVSATAAALGVDRDTAEVVVHAVAGFMVTRLLDGKRTPFEPLVDLVLRLVDAAAASAPPAGA